MTLSKEKSLKNGRRMGRQAAMSATPISSIDQNITRLTTAT